MNEPQTEESMSDAAIPSFNYNDTSTNHIINIPHTKSKYYINKTE
jgi:hypothetical protein